jgi:hypothetical protein
LLAGWAAPGTRTWRLRVAACLPAAAARLDGSADLATGKLSSSPVVEQLLFFYLPALSSVQTTPVHPPGRFLPAGDELVYVCTPLRPVVARMDVRTRYLISGVFLLLSGSGARMVLC